MPSMLELANNREARKLRLAGFNPDGTPINAQTPPVDDDNDDGQQPPIDDDDGQQPPAPPQGGGDDQHAALLERIAKLERERDAAINRVAPTQQESETTRRLWLQSQQQLEEERRASQERIEALERQVNERLASQNIESLLDDEEREAVDPTILKIIDKVSRARAEQLIPKIDTKAEVLRTLQERELAKVEEHRNMVLTDPSRGLNKLSSLLSDPEFQEWYSQEDNILDSVMSSLVNAKTTEAVDRYAKTAAKVLQGYYTRNKQTPDPTSTIERHARRTAPKKLTQAEVDAKLAEVKRLTRAGKHTEAENLLKEIDNLTT